MVWVNRETSGIDPFVSTLQAAQDDTRNGVFHFSLHVDVGLDAGETQVQATKHHDWHRTVTV